MLLETRCCILSELRVKKRVHSMNICSHTNDWKLMSCNVLYPQIQEPKGDVTITNDGATILQQMKLAHPAAKMVTLRS